MTEFETNKQAAIDVVLQNTTAIAESGGLSVLAALRALATIDATTTQSALDGISIREILGTPTPSLVSYVVLTDTDDELTVQYTNQLTNATRTISLAAFPSFPTVRAIELERYVVGNSPIWIDPVPQTRAALVSEFDRYIAAAAPSLNEQSLNYKILATIDALNNSTPPVDELLASLVSDYISRLNTPT